MNEQDINQLNRYLYQELEDCTKLINTLKQMNLDTYELKQKRNMLNKSLVVSLNKLEAIWNAEKVTD